MTSISRLIARRGLMLIASVSLLFCSCQTLTPATNTTTGRSTIAGPGTSAQPVATQPLSGQAWPAQAQQHGAAVAPFPGPAATAIAPHAAMPDAIPLRTASTTLGQVLPVAHATPVSSRCSTCNANHGSGQFHLPPSLPEMIGFSNLPPDVARDELLCNGGDRDPRVIVRNDWSVDGLHLGDAVAHYDTIDGHTYVQPTNDVCLYAPRFAAVRRVSGVSLHEQHQKSAGVELPTRVGLHDETLIATTVLQPLQPTRSLSVNGPNSFREHTRGAGLDNTAILLGADGSLQPYQELAIIRRGVFDDTEKARLWNSLQAAVAWSQDTMLQVVLDGKIAVELTSDVGMQAVHTYELPQGKSRLRIVKIADKQNARPGDVVDFTIRFDNVGDQVIGNVTVMDSLSPRLEYIEDSQKCSLKADFMTQPNDGESLVLRWEIVEPMKVGDGGVIRFQCRVR